MTEPSAKTTPPANPRILVVDDDPLSCRLLKQVLSHAGFDVITAIEGAAAMELVRTNAPDLLVLDFEMPGMSGIDLCRRIRKELESGLSELPVLMLTAHSTEADEIRCWEAGANDFVSKPVSRSVLVARIKTQLRLQALSRELRAQNEELSRWRDEREADLEAARSTQQVILPTEPPDFEGWETHSIYTPIIQVGGDIFGWRAGADGAWIYWIADATGHGASAALFTTLAALLFNGGGTITSPGALLERVNERFYSVFQGHSIMSACCLLVQPDGRALFANAGHPPLLIRRENGEVEAVTERETMLGIHNHLKFADTETLIHPGDTALLFTDGLHSLFDKNDKRMEESAVRVALAGIHARKPVLGALLKSLKLDSNGGEFMDDVAAVSIHRK
jgi:sigma-B regulation protein RsbU (phosphoserine phosphatase)